MSYPKCVYHKNYDTKHMPNHEKHLIDNSRVVHNDAELKLLGPDWGAHPNEKSVQDSEEKNSKKKVLSEVEVEQVLEEVVSTAPEKLRKARKL